MTTDAVAEAVAEEAHALVEELLAVKKEGVWSEEHQTALMKLHGLKVEAQSLYM